MRSPKNIRKTIDDYSKLLEFSVFKARGVSSVTNTNRFRKDSNLYHLDLKVRKATGVNIFDANTDEEYAKYGEYIRTRISACIALIHDVPTNRSSRRGTRSSKVLMKGSDSSLKVVVSQVFSDFAKENVMAPPSRLKVRTAKVNSRNKRAFTKTSSRVIGAQKPKKKVPAD